MIPLLLQTRQMHHHIPPPGPRGFANTPAPFNEGKVLSYTPVTQAHRANSALHTEALKRFFMLYHTWQCILQWVLLS